MRGYQLHILLTVIFTLIFSLNYNAVSPKIRNGKGGVKGKVLIPLKPYVTLYKIYWKSVFFQVSCNIAKYICGLEDHQTITTQRPQPAVTPPPIVTASSATPPPTSGPPQFQVVYMVVEDKMNWMEAHVNCKVAGYDLTTVEDNPELINLQGVIANSNLTTTDFIWTAGNDILRNGNYTWVSTGQSFVDFFPVGNIEPTQLPNEDCVFLYFTPTFNMFVMADYSCDFKAASICKKII